MTRKKTTALLVCSSATAYLTLVAASGNTGVEAVFSDGELREDAVIQDFRTTDAHRCLVS